MKVVSGIFLLSFFAQVLKNFFLLLFDEANKKSKQTFIGMLEEGIIIERRNFLIQVMLENISNYV
jgi:hypothetical protein